MNTRIEHDLLLTAERCAERTALEEGDTSWSFGQLASRACAVADALRKRGLQPTDRVVLFARKSLDLVAALYGTWMAGCVAVPASWELRRPQLAHIVEHSGASLVIGEAHLLSALDAPPLAAPTVALSSLEGAGGRTGVDPSLDGGNTCATLIYTSGSTGMPKGIEVTHDNLLAGARIVSGYLSLDASDRVLSVLPFHFDYGLNQLLTCVRQGATLVLQRSTHPGAIVRALNDNRITGLAGVPPLWVQLMAPGSPFGRRDFPHLRYLTNSGGCFPPDLLQRYVAAVPRAEIFLMYGLSEAFRSTFLPPDELSRRPTSIGKAMPETEVFVVDDDDRLSADDAPGQLVHRGPTVARGYYNDPEASARRFRPDPFDRARGAPVVYSGDLVRRDREGFLYFIGRTDQQLKRFGHRVSPEEVESALQRSELVELALVGAEPDPVAGQALVAHVVPASARCTVEALQRYCHQTMPRYLSPSRFEFHERFPLTSSGKIDRVQVLSS